MPVPGGALTPRDSPALLTLRAGKPRARVLISTSSPPHSPGSRWPTALPATQQSGGPLKACFQQEMLQSKMPAKYPVEAKTGQMPREGGTGRGTLNKHVVPPHRSG